MFKLKTFFSRIMSIEPIRRQSIVSLVWQIAFTFIGFLSTMYFAHAVGAGVLGAYFLFMAYFSIIGLMTDGGLGGAATKRISEGEEPDAYFSAFVVLRSVFVTVVLTALLALRSYFVDLDSEGTFTWLLVALVVSLLHGAVSSGIAGRGKMGINATAGFINNVSRILVQVVAVFLGYGVAGLAGGFVLGMLVGSIIQLRFFDLHFVRFGWRHLKSLSSFSFWSFLISGGSLVFMNSDSVMIGYFLNNADVGVYRIIFQFTALAAFITTALRGTLWPRVSRWDKIGEMRLIEESISRAFTYSLILAVPLFVGGALLGDKLLYFFYGADFVNYTTLMILFAVQIINIFQYFFTTYLSAMNQLKELFKITVVAVGINIALNAALIPAMGISGAAVATLITMSLNAVLARRVLAQMITLRIERSSLLNIFKASVAMGIVVGVYRMLIPLSNVWLALVPVVLGGVIYVVLVLKFDRKIYEELKGIVLQMNVVWPEWL
ncbi:MAG: oligosaccharide flippase family protein [Methanosarcinaceae archaeon]|nr:oligosaccharide flippase family protein [Methanosarcinaceae archaeon]